MKPSKRPSFPTLDIRPTLARGDEPFEQIMTTVAALASGEGFLLVSPFLPSPLVEKLQSEGFRVRPERRPDGSWQTQFVRL